MAARLRARLVRERPDWRIVTRGSQARYETVWRDEAVDSAELAVTAAGPARFARTLPFGRYRLEVAEPGGMAVTSVRFRAAGRAARRRRCRTRSMSPPTAAPMPPGEVGQAAHHPALSGPASLAVLTDRLVSIQEIAVAEGGTEVEVPVDAAWGPGAYVAVTAFRPGEARQGHPGRALGLAWLQVDPASRRIEVSIGTPDRVPRAAAGRCRCG